MSNKFDRYKAEFLEQGFFVVRKLFENNEVISMLSQIKEIISGGFKYEGRRFQSEAVSGNYEDLEFSSMDYSGPDVQYRKISDLEYDPVFLKNLKNPKIQEICNNFVGSEVSIMRVTLMDKAPRGGTPLPYHQDLSKKWPISKSPEFVIWFCLDPSSEENGSLCVIPGSHRQGLIEEGHMISKEMVNSLKSKLGNTYIRTNPGDCVFFHPALIHSSGVNKTSLHRRSVNAVLFKGEAKNLKSGKTYPYLFGKDALELAL